MITIDDVINAYKYKCPFMLDNDLKRFNDFLTMRVRNFTSGNFDKMIMTAREIMETLDKKNTVPIEELLSSTLKDKIQYYLKTTIELKNEVQVTFLKLWRDIGIDAKIQSYSDYNYAGQTVLVDDTPLFFVPMEEVLDPVLSISYDGSKLFSATSNEFSTITLNTANTYLTSDIIITVPSDFSINISYFSYDTIVASASGTTITLQTANKILEDNIIITQ